MFELKDIDGIESWTMRGLDSRIVSGEFGGTGKPRGEFTVALYGPPNYTDLVSALRSLGALGEMFAPLAEAEEAEAATGE